MSDRRKPPALGKVEPGPNNFPIIAFRDRDGVLCTLQMSSLIGRLPRSLDLDDLDQVALNFPGTSFIWLGAGLERMHLGREQVKELIQRLEEWLTTGKFDE